ncbi:MAG: iron-containing alcohol dehydrogenase, partial [Clostridia bacterium]|nr:iron-containing alcohol dehydrogenase [Clostridia bacterium]
MSQVIRTGIESFDAIFEELRPKRVFFVCDEAFAFLPGDVKNVYLSRRDSFTLFDSFTPNPLYEQVCKGVELFKKDKCDVILAMGGGSAIDVAKCVKLYCRMDENENYLKQECKDSGVPLIAIPTTAGTGSESTRYAVIYYEGKKQSVTHESIVPNYVVLEPGV